MNDAPVVLAVLLLASGDPFTWLTPLLVVYELAVGGAIGALFGLGGAWALRRVALPSTGLYPLATIAVCVLAYSLEPAGARLRVPRPPTWPRWCWATPTCRTAAGSARSPRAWAGWPRSGCSCCSGCTPHRPRLLDAVLPALVAGRGAGAGRPDRCRCWPRPCRSASRGGSRSFLSWSGLRGAVPIVLALIALTEGAPGARPWSTWCSCWSWCSPCCRAPRCRWVARRLGMLQHRRTPRARRRRGPAGRAGRRPAAGAHPGRVPAARGVPAGAAAAPGGHGEPGGARRARPSPRPRRPGCASATSCWWSPRRRPAPRPRTGSGPWTAGQAGPLARRPRAGR